MKLKTSIALAGLLLAVCAGAAIVCGRQAYRIGYDSTGSVALPDETKVEPLEALPGATPASAGGGAIVSEAEFIRRVNGLTNYSSYGPPNEGG